MAYQKTSQTEVRPSDERYIVVSTDSHVGPSLGRQFGGGQLVTRLNVSSKHFMVQPRIAALGGVALMPPDDQEIDWMCVADAAYAVYLAVSRPMP